MELVLKKNFEKAFLYYKLSANLGDTDAQCMVGECYENGHGVRIELKEARRYYKLAEKEGNQKAETAIRRLDGQKSKNPPRGIVHQLHQL